MSNQHTYSPPCPFDDLRAFHESGMSQQEIADRVGVSQHCIWLAMRKAGIKSHPRNKRDQHGDRNPAWKGDAATYAGFHYRVNAIRGKPQKCNVCGTTDPDKSYDWANLTGNYGDVEDYERMCRSCHWKYDKKHLNLGRYAVKQEAKSCES